MASLLVGCSAGHPSDADLKRRFNEKRAEFEQIVAMLRVDATMVRIAPEFCQATGHVDASYQHWIEDPKISDKRWYEYRAAFRRIGASAGVAASADRTSALFLMSTEGLSIGGSAKGIAFMMTPPPTLVENLDRPVRSGKAGMSHVKIADHWYIFYEWTN